MSVNIKTSNGVNEINKMYLKTGDGVSQVGKVYEKTGTGVNLIYTSEETYVPDISRNFFCNHQSDINYSIEKTNTYTSLYVNVANYSMIYVVTEIDVTNINEISIDFELYNVNAPSGYSCVRAVGLFSPAQLNSTDVWSVTGWANGISGAVSRQTITIDTSNFTGVYYLGIKQKAHASGETYTATAKIYSAIGK